MLTKSRTDIAPRLALAATLLLCWHAAWGSVTPAGSVVTQGGDPADDGPVLPTPGNLLVPISDQILLGDLSSLLVDGGSFVQAGSIATLTTTTSSVVTVTGPSSRIELLGLVDRISLHGTSSLTIANGAVVDSADTTGCTFSVCGINVGTLSGSDATLTVSGAGSVLNATNGLVLGLANVVGTPNLDATGRLIIDNGGIVNADRVALAQGTGGDPTLVSRGFVDISGAGSALNATEIIIGNNISPIDNGIGAITIADGGALTATGVIVAGLGVNTDATISVDTGGSLSALALYGARGAGSVSDFSFDGAGTTITLGDELIVGQGSNGTLSITNGAVVDIGGGVEAGFIGSTLMLGTTGGTGTGIIDNATVTLSPNTDLPEVRLSVGVLGTGSLIIQNGASLTVQDLTGGLGVVGDGITVGASAPGLAADGTLVIQGAGTTVSLDSIDLSALVLGISPNGVDAATGLVEILDGAAVSISGTGFNSGINVGRGGNSTATLNVAGAGTTVDVIGPQGIINVASNFGGEIGDTNAFMNVTDGALITLAGLTPGQGYFSVGHGAGTGLLQVNTGGRIDVDGSLQISVANANGNTQVGTVSVTDTGTHQHHQHRSGQSRFADR